MNGKQVRINIDPTIEGKSAQEFILQNADSIWLHQNELWEYIEQVPNDRPSRDKKDEPLG